MSNGPEDPADRDTSIWDKHDAMLNPKTGKKDRLLTLNFIQKYLQLAKTIKPTLSDEACELIGEEYSRCVFITLTIFYFFLNFFREIMVPHNLFSDSAPHPTIPRAMPEPSPSLPVVWRP